MGSFLIGDDGVLRLATRKASPPLAQQQVVVTENHFHPCRKVRELGTRAMSPHLNRRRRHKRSG